MAYVPRSNHRGRRFRSPFHPVADQTLVQETGAAAAGALAVQEPVDIARDVGRLYMSRLIARRRICLHVKVLQAKRKITILFYVLCLCYRLNLLQNLNLTASGHM